MSAWIDSGVLATLVGGYHDRDVVLFQVSGRVLADMEEGSWTGPVAFRLVREQGAIVTMEVHDLRPMFEDGWNGVVESNQDRDPASEPEGT